MPAQLLIFASDDSNIRYASGLDIPDPFIYVKLASKEYVLVSTLELSRAKRQARHQVKVLGWDEVSLKNIKNPVKRARNLADVASAFILSFGETQVVIPKNTWALHVDTLQEHGIRPRIEEPFFPSRRIKTPEEIKSIKRVGKVAKEAFEHATTLLRRATIEWDDALVVDGEKLTSERVKMEIENIFQLHGCSSNGTIVSCGPDSAEPHNRGSGLLRAGQPIILDLFPRDRATGYHFDMTRTVVKGTPTQELREMYDAVKEAQASALGVVKPGRVKPVHEAVISVFRRHGFKTTSEEGFIHSTGHGLGLDVHEFPRISDKSEEVLEPGMVVTIEPGLYYREHGGIRLEDTVVITKNGHTNLTNTPKTLVLR